MKPVAEVARERNTTIEDVLVHLKRAGMELADGQTEVDEDIVDKAFATTSSGPRRARPGGAGNRRRRVVIDAQASRRGPGPSNDRRGRRDRHQGGDRAEAALVVPAEGQKVKVPSGSSVKDVSQLMGVSTAEIIKTMMGYGEMATITQPLSAVMGHVDHGKTSLLDAIRETEVAAGEAGGITQHIGAYQVKHDGKSITFLDTPGHEAFTAMRARGAKVTDIAAIVVAADDGVMPQTVEAIDHAKAAAVPMVIVINKIDKPDANIEKIKQQLTEFSIVPEEWGGDTVFVEASAKKRIGLANFLDMLQLVADVQDLKANPDAPASGVIIEAKVDVGRGVVVTMLVERGTIHVGDAIVAGEASGRVRAMHDFRGRPITEAGPSVPVEIIGFDSVPDAGEFCRVVKDEKAARVLANRRTNRLRAEGLAKQHALTLDDLYARIAEGEVGELNLVIKADVQGSIEALADALGQISHDEVKVNIIHRGVGGINESDVMLATASKAIIIGFNVRPNAPATALAETEGVDIRTYRVIYKVTEDVQAALVGLLKPDVVEEVLGQAEVRQLFKVSRLGTIAGCYVTRGKITRSASIRVLRDGIVVHDGRLASLKRFNEDTREAAEGFECGILLDGFNDLKEGDTLEAYETKEVARGG